MRFKAVAAMATVVGWAIGIVWIVPLMGVFMASIRPFSEIVSGWWNFNEFNPTLSNFVRAWNHSYFPLGRAMLNSFIVSIPSTILPLTVASIAAYGFSRFRFPLKNQLFTILLVLSAIPGQMIALPIFKLYLRVGLLNTFAGLILLHSGVGCIWITFFMKNFFDTLPPEIEDAARVDGASDFVILKSIVLPLSLPALASAGILQFIWVWNDFFFAIVVLSDITKFTVTQCVPLLAGKHVIDLSLVAAGALIASSVPFIVYALTSKYFIRGLIGWTIRA